MPETNRSYLSRSHQAQIPDSQVLLQIQRMSGRQSFKAADLKYADPDLTKSFTAERLG
jgi:hypothetical protein